METVNKLYEKVRLPQLKNLGTYSVFNELYNTNEFGFFADIDTLECFSLFYVGGATHDKPLIEMFDKLYQIKLPWIKTTLLIECPDIMTGPFLMLLKKTIVEHHIHLPDKYLANEIGKDGTTVTYIESNNMLNKSKQWFTDFVEYLSLLIDKYESGHSLYEHLENVRKIVETYNMVFLYVDGDVIDMLAPFMLPQLSINKQIKLLGNIPDNTETVLNIEHFYGEYESLLTREEAEIGDVVVINNGSVNVIDNIKINKSPFSYPIIYNTRQTETIYHLTIDELNPDLLTIFFSSKHIMEIAKTETGLFAVIFNMDSYEYSDLVYFKDNTTLSDDYILLSDQFKDFIENEESLFTIAQNSVSNATLFDFMVKTKNAINPIPAKKDKFIGQYGTIMIEDRKLFFKIPKVNDGPIFMLGTKTVMIFDPFMDKDLRRSILLTGNEYGYFSLDENLQFNKQLETLIKNNI